VIIFSVVSHVLQVTMGFLISQRHVNAIYMCVIDIASFILIIDEHKNTMGYNTIAYINLIILCSHHAPYHLSYTNALVSRKEQDMQNINM
jgi:hypothetical protein